MQRNYCSEHYNLIISSFAMSACVYISGLPWRNASLYTHFIYSGRNAPRFIPGTRELMIVETIIAVAESIDGYLYYWKKSIELKIKKYLRTRAIILIIYYIM